MPLKGPNIPAELKAEKRWLVWRWKRDTDKNKWDKPPLCVDGTDGSSTNTKKWATYQDAFETLTRKGSDYDGIGYAMGKDGCGLVGVDIDGCRNPETGEISAFAQEIIDDLGTYTEVSPSGTGVKMWLRGRFDGDKWRCQHKPLGLEVYCKGRYFTVTGHIVGKVKTIEPIGSGFSRMLVNYMQRDETHKDRPKDPAQTIAVAREAVKAIDPLCDYKTWIDVGMALHWLSEDLFEVWDQWSAGAGDGNYPGSEKLQAHWRSFSGKQSKITIGTLFHYAKEAGFKMPEPTYERSDYGMARRVRDAVKGRLYYVPEWSKWIAWDGRRFVEDRANHLYEAIVAVSKEMVDEVDPPEDEKDKEAVQAYKAWLGFCGHYQNARGIKDVEQLCRGLMAVDYSTLDRNPMLFHCENAVINLDSRKPQEHDRENLNTKLSQVVYNPDAKCPRWIKFIAEITLGDKQLADYLQRICGYCLSGLVEHESLFILHGEGSNGKSVFTKTLLALLGDDYGGVVQQELLMAAPNQHPTQFAYLYGRRCVVAQETDQDCRLNENQVKALTGGDRIQCRRMREDFWEFEPSHKIFLATNHVPIIRGTDKGIWRRVKLIPFNAKFDGSQIDNKLASKLAAELPGILNWCIEGFCNYLFDGLHEPEIVQRARDAYKLEMNPLQQFVEDKCVMDPASEVKSSVLYQAFKLYCEENGHYLPSQRKFSNDLEAMHIKSGRTNRDRTKIGIYLVSEFPVTQ